MAAIVSTDPAAITTLAVRTRRRVEVALMNGLTLRVGPERVDPTIDPDDRGIVQTACYRTGPGT